MALLVIRPEAQVDLLEARNWYNGQRAGLGAQFVDAVEVFFDEISANPELYAKTIKEVRRETSAVSIRCLFTAHWTIERKYWQSCTVAATHAFGNDAPNIKNCDFNALLYPHGVRGMAHRTSARQARCGERQAIPPIEESILAVSHLLLGSVDCLIDHVSESLSSLDH
jgi:hypothetical protein